MIAATNRPDLLDDAIVRPGRLDRHVLVGPPSGEARVGIVRSGLGKARLGGGARKPSWAEVREATAGFSGAECEAVGRGAAMRAMQRALESAESKG